MRSPVGVHEHDCPFCAYRAGRVIPDLVEPSLVSLQNDHAHAFPSLHERGPNRGHHLVVPAQHTPDIYRLQDHQLSGLLATVRATALAVRAAFGATGITVMQHNEWDGGQDVFHMHFHVVPRRAGDGFYHGPDRWPHDLELISVEDRRDQAARVRAAHATPAPPPPTPSDTYA